MRRLVLAAFASTLMFDHATARDAGLVVGSGNYFSPIVANLERAVAFYHDGLGLDVMGTPSTAADNAPLRNMFGLPGAQLRWTVARPTGSRQGVEIVEIAQAGGRLLDRRITDAGAMTLVMSTVEPLREVIARVKTAGGTQVGTGGNENVTGQYVALVRDADDHFVQLNAAAKDAPPLAPRIRMTVQNLDRTTALYRDGLGIDGFASVPAADEWLTALGVTRRPDVATSAVVVSGSKLVIEFVQFKEAGRSVKGRIQDPGSTRLQLQVRDLDAAIKAVVRAGGHVVSTAGRPVELPAGRGAPIRAAIVQDPDNLFLVLIQAAPPRA